LDNLTGRYHVRALRSALKTGRHIMPKSRDRAELRRHALKLRYWPDNVTMEPSGQVVDLDWSWIKALRGNNVGELRIGDVIGGHDNLRVIFFVAGPVPGESMDCIWVLDVFQKKRNEFTGHEISTFKGKRAIVMSRFYGPTG
jgi:hypothetical protein